MDSLPHTFAELSPFSPKAIQVLNLQINRRKQSGETIPPILNEKLHALSDTDDDATPSSSFAFFLSFKLLPKDLEQKRWLIGKGPDIDQLDIVVAPSDEAITYASLYFHPRSGYLMLDTLKQSRVKIKKGNTFVTSTTACLAFVENIFAIGSLEYCLKYTITDTDQYAANRETLIQTDSIIRHPRFSVFPGNDCSIHGDYIVQNETIASGAFGFVSAGVHRMSGEPVAVKEIRVEEHKCPESIMNEAKMSLLFKKDIPGILQTEATMCEHGKEFPCQDYPEKFFIITRLASSDFRTADWTSVSSVHRLNRFKYTLQGLCHLHRCGYIHCDITIRNLLLFPNDRAVISDFGKMIQAATASGTSIGPAHTLAPEVWTNKYNSAIDIWSLAYAWLATYPGEVPEPRQIDTKAHSKILAKINDLKETGAIDKRFALLLQKMLHWEATDRITASEALEYWQVHLESAPASSNPVNAPSYFEESEGSSGYENTNAVMYDRSIQPLYYRPGGFPGLAQTNTTRQKRKRYHESSSAG